jgi:hypothetical protein
LEKGKILPLLPIIPLSEVRLQILKEYLDKILQKGFIRESILLAGISIFFVPKLEDTKEQPVINYRGLNKITVKDIYILLLASELRDRIGKAKYFIKLDQYVGFNLIRIKEGDK